MYAAPLLPRKHHDFFAKIITLARTPVRAICSHPLAGTLEGHNAGRVPVDATERKKDMMNLTAHRISRNQFGTISYVTGEYSGESLFLFYEDPKPIPAGEYICIRGDHPIHKNVFELQNVPGRTAILIHIGNGDSETLGCLLPGMSIGLYWNEDKEPHFGIAGGASKPAYDKLMKIQGDTNAFRLTIIDDYPETKT